jgi:hypothetical protein
LFGAAGSSVVVYYITASGSKRLTMMENTTTANISATEAWQKVLRQNAAGRYYIRSPHFPCQYSGACLFVAGVANNEVLLKIVFYDVI